MKAPAAALEDVATVSTPRGDAALPHTFAQLRYLLQRMYALWSTLLGAQHPLTRRYHEFHDNLVKREKFLETVEPADRGQRHLVPALVDSTAHQSMVTSTSQKCDAGTCNGI